MRFKTSKGEIVTGDKLQKALDKVADDWMQMCIDIRNEDAYASHVSEQAKMQRLVDGLLFAKEIRQGMHINGFTIWQRVNTVLTGECVAFLPE